MQFALQVNGAANGVVITLPDGSQIKGDTKIAPGQFILCKGNQAYLGDNYRKKIADLTMQFPAGLCPWAIRRLAFNSRRKARQKFLST